MKKTPVIALVVAVASLISGCATSPENIAPAYVSHLAYMSYSVEQLGQEEARLQAALSTSSDAQRKARSNDTLGVIFLGLPVSSLSGSNQASNVARIKGELEAVQKAIVLKGGKATEMPAGAAPQATQLGQPSSTTPAAPAPQTPSPK